MGLGYTLYGPRRGPLGVWQGFWGCLVSIFRWSDSLATLRPLVPHRLMWTPHRFCPAFRSIPQPVAVLAVSRLVPGSPGTLGSPIGWPSLPGWPPRAARRRRRLRPAEVSARAALIVSVVSK